MWGWLNLPEQASAHAARMDNFIGLVYIIIISGFMFWFTWFLIALVKHRKSKNPDADYTGIKGKWPYIPVAVIEYRVNMSRIHYPFMFLLRRHVRVR